MVTHGYVCAFSGSTRLGEGLIRGLKKNHFLKQNLASFFGFPVFFGFWFRMVFVERPKLMCFAICMGFQLVD